MKINKRSSSRKAKFEAEKAERDEEHEKDSKPEQDAPTSTVEGAVASEHKATPELQQPLLDEKKISVSDQNEEESILSSISVDVADEKSEVQQDVFIKEPAVENSRPASPEVGGKRFENAQSNSPRPVSDYTQSVRAAQSVSEEIPKHVATDPKVLVQSPQPQVLESPESSVTEMKGEVAISQSVSEVEEFAVFPKDKRSLKKNQKKKRKKGKGGAFEDEGESDDDHDKIKKAKSKARERLAFSDRLVRIALTYTRAPTRFLVARMPSLRDNLLRSNLRISPEGIVSLSLLFSIIAFPFTIIGWYLLTQMGFGLEGLALPFAAAVPFLIGITIPKISASSRAQALDNELPYLFAYITVLAGGGISPMVTLKRITKASVLFPAASKEAKRILMDIEIFGLDAISALERGARLTPNRVFSDFIGGYVAVLKTGGDALSFLEAKLKEIFGYREAKVRSGSEFIATMSEAYIITTVIMGISLMTLFATQNLMTPSITTLNYSMILMFSGFFVPIISLIFIIVIGSSQIREPYSYDLPFYIFLGCIPIGALIYFLPLHLTSYMQLGVALAAISTPPMFFQMRYKRDKDSVEAKLANFLRDISEIRKTGLAPEKTIEQLANRNYGKLGPHVKKIAAQLSWGTPIKTVLHNFTSEVKSWVGRAVAFLLLEVVDVGGGSAKMFISLADFAEKNAQLEKEKKSLVRPYIIIPYIGAILIVATTAMMVYFVSPVNLTFPGVGQPGTNYLPPAYIISEATTILLMGSFFQAWVMGFVAGKMGEGSAADGFKHATFLIIISIVTVLVSGLFIQL